MSATIATKPATLEDFLALPEGPPHHEFEEGEIIPLASPSSFHQELIAILFTQLRMWVRKHKLGQVLTATDVFLPDGRVFIPDISYLRSENERHWSPDDTKIHGIPDLAVEVVSSNEYRDRSHKFQVYYDNGVEWYWLIDPIELTIEEYHAGQTEYAQTADVARAQDFRPGLFSGLVVNLEELLK